jgi:hypothetical protein
VSSDDLADQTDATGCTGSTKSPDEEPTIRHFLELVKPRMDRGMSAGEIAAELRTDEERIAQEVERFTKPYSQRDGAGLFTEVVTTLKHHFHFEKESNARLVALFIMQAHVAKGLPGVFYIAVPGGKGCGKTNLLNIIRALTNGRMFENISVAALARSIDYGVTICIDEFDVDREKEVNEVRDALIRQGYKADGSKYARWNAAKREIEEISVYGPKAIAYRGKIDIALLDRSYIVPVEKYIGDNGYEFTRVNIWKEVGDLSDRLANWGALAVKTFPQEVLANLAATPDFQANVKNTTESFGASRGTELAIYANLVAHMVGIEVSEDVAAADKIRLVEDDSADEQAEVQEALLEVLKEGKAQKALEGIKEIRIPQKAVKDRVNERRKERDERPLSDVRFKVLRREIGIKEAWVRPCHGKNEWAIPVSFLVTLQAIMANLPTLFDNPVQQEPRGDQVGQVGQLREDFDKGVGYVELVAKYGQDLVEREKMPKIGGRGE